MMRRWRSSSCSVTDFEIAICRFEFIRLGLVLRLLLHRAEFGLSILHLLALHLEFVSYNQHNRISECGRRNQEQNIPGLYLQTVKSVHGSQRPAPWLAVADPLVVR
jgi:hypothetical protein